jgi:hypothetical protein
MQGSIRPTIMLELKEGIRFPIPLTYNVEDIIILFLIYKILLFCDAFALIPTE